MSGSGNPAVAARKEYPLGVSRPPLVVDDLPTPEEVFRVPKFGFREVVVRVIGPSLIALGISIGSGEWLLGPLAVGQSGFIGIGWVILVSAILQVFYNVEITRYTMATGEVPVLGWGRVPPGFQFWVPVSLFIMYFAFIWGGWVRGAGESLYVLLTGRIPTPADQGTVILLSVILMGVVLVLTMFGGRISRTLELANWFIVGFILITLLIVDLTIVPIGKWVEGIVGMVTPAVPPAGTSAATLGGLAGFTAAASGLNWYILNYYRDKGYGMGHRVGYIAGLVGGEQHEILPSGKILADTPENNRLWKRWFRFLMLDQWVVFFTGAILGMLLTTILVSYLVSLPGVERPTAQTMPTFAASVLGRFFNPILFYWALLAGFFILFSTQIGIYESLVRNMADALYGTSASFRRLIAGDPRRFYYPFMIVLAIVIAIILQSGAPTQLVTISANMSNLGALIFPFMLMYLNSKLPGSARMPWWSYVTLILNILFFGFFFVNFASAQLTGRQLVTF